ncbi:CdaR family transcriptional regulator [Cohnella cellulosilytica]|uniref:CdaR family transcriptional regulator n=1 Tax=Cohnella cellulosilytica TaxID=986710 RepID=A0ABW2FPE4_9BACL
MLTKELAEMIVRETMERLNRNINIFDAEGVVLASGDSSRIGQVHEAAREAVRKNKAYEIEEGVQARWKGALAGVNLPICYDGFAVGAVGITGRPDDVKPFGELVKMTAELMLRQQQLERQRNWKQFVVDRVVDELVEGETAAKANRTELNGRLRPVSFALHPPYQAATVQTVHPVRDGESAARLLQLLSRYLAGEALVSQRQDGEWIILFANREPDRVKSMVEGLPKIGRSVHQALLVGVGDSVDDLRLVPDSCRESKAVLKLNSTGEGGIAYYEDRAWEAVIAEISPASKRKMIEAYRPHLPPKTGETLDCFFRCGLNVAAAASRLGIHRNTMIYRLEQIKLATGCNPQIFRHALTLQLVLWLIKQDEAPGA